MSFDITGVGSSLPNFIASNHDLSNIVDTSDEWISTRTGIKKRHILTKESLLDISVKAAKEALADAGITADKLDYIICSTLQGDFIAPAHACLIQQEINAKCPAFDVNSGCTGFVNALFLADSIMASGKAKQILIVSADKLTKFIDWTDRATCVLFGDGAGAVVLSKGNSLKYIKLYTEGSKDHLFLPGTNPPNPFNPDAPPNINYFSMNGQEVFKFAVSSVIKSVKAACKELMIKTAEITKFVLHQANGRIVDMIQAVLKEPKEKFPTNYQHCGNTSSASIPLLLSFMQKNGQLKNGDRLLISAFGAGLSYGTCILDWNK